MHKWGKWIIVTITVVLLSACGISIDNHSEPPPALEGTTPEPGDVDNPDGDQTPVPLSIEVSGIAGNMIGLGETITLTASISGENSSEALISWKYYHDGAGEPGAISEVVGFDTVFSAPDTAGDGHHLTAIATYEDEEAFWEESFSIGLCSAGAFTDQTEPCIINNVVQLQAIGATKDAMAGHYKLGGDVDASQTGTWNDGLGFTPLGLEFDTDGKFSEGESSPFTGTFDGNYHTIDGLHIDFRSLEEPTPTGLFFAVAEDGVISNLRIHEAKVYGAGATGTLVAHLNGATVSNVVVTESILSTDNGPTIGGLVGISSSNSVISRSGVENLEITVPSQTRSDSGGLTGQNNGRIEWSSAVGGSISASNGGSNVGGLVGANIPLGPSVSPQAGIYHSTADNQALVGGYVGGLIGRNELPVEGSLASYQTIYSYSHTGGFAGVNSGLMAAISHSHVVESDISVHKTFMPFGAGGFVGVNTDTGRIFQSSATETSLDGSYNVGGFVGSNHDGGQIDSSFVLSKVNKDIMGGGALGGFVGENKAEITNSYAMIGDVTGGSGVGGFAGRNIQETGKIKNTFVHALPTGTDARGFASFTDGEAEITDSYWSMEAAGNVADNSGATGLSTNADFNDPNNFPTWDFHTVWQMPEDGGPPDLINNSRF